MTDHTLSADDVQREPPILLGEAPSKTGDRYHMFPLSGRPARVLCELAGIPPQPDGSTYGRWTWALYDVFEAMNLIERYRDAEPWSVPRTRDAARELLPELAGRVVLLLGRRVQEAVHGAALGGVTRVDLHDWTTLPAAGGNVQVATIPHPSGLNRVLNDPVERQRAGATLRAAIERARLTAG